MPEKILVVDDDIDSLKLIGLMLQRHGYDVSAANAGSQALAKAVSEHPDLIILDVMMPDMNGYEVCRRLRANHETQAIPIIMFTAKTLIDDKVAGFEAGADDYLTKPTHPAELAAKVRALLTRSAGQRRVEPSRGVAIGLIGAKGGVGTTTIALNVAASLVQAGEKSVIADFRLGNGSLGLSIGVGRAQGMANVLAKPANEIRPKLVEEELVTHQSGLRALLSSARPREAQIDYSVESALAVVRALRTLGRPAVFDLGSTLTTKINRIQREMDLLLVVVEPLSVTLTMARELIADINAVRASGNRAHVVVVNRTQSGNQIPWHEVEQLIGQEIRAIISSAPELTFQAMQAGTPMVVMQPNAIVPSQIAKLSEDLNARANALAAGQLVS